METKISGKNLFSADVSLLVTILTILISTRSVLSQTSGADLMYNIVEEESIGTYIGTITENQNLYRNLTSSQRKQLRYGLLDQSRYPASLFRVDEASGGIYVAKRIDRESTQCYKQPQCELELNVALSSARIPFSNIATVLITVSDKNDNPPYFPAQESGSVVLDMSEWATVGTALKLSGAADRDYASNNTVKRYSLTAYTSMFSINSSNNLDGSSVLDLTLLKPLDREATSTYRFLILAFDGGSPPLSASLNVQIRVTDENDHPPNFLNNTYEVEIRDELAPNQIILQVSASDLDSGPYGQVRYQFSSLQREQLERKFHVNEATGEISAVSSPPAGTQQFIVEALDGGNPPRKSQTVVTVKVISSKNNPPTVQINTLSNGSNSFVEIPEDASLGAFVAFVTAEDPDEGLRGQVTCQLNGGVLSLATLAGKGYTLTLQSSLDRETQDSYNVTVTCSDAGEPRMSSVRSVLVIVTDVNDNPPQFTWKSFNHTIPEGNYTDRHIIQVIATDPDMGKNAEVIYSIDGSARPPFRIDPVTGIISAQGSLDRETIPVYSFKVYAVDRGLGPKTATAVVNIILQDVNDQYPAFNQTIFEYRIPEDAPEHTVLGKLTAHDNDVGMNGQFEFFYAGSLDGADPFVVESNGTVWSSGQLDRERRESYSFTVMVRDRGATPKTTYASVVVTVLDVNDNSPKIQFPVAGNHTIHVTTVPEPDMVLAKIVAYDSDAGENGSLHFLVSRGNEDGALDIDPSGGQVKVKDAGKLRNKSVYRLTIGVEDYGLPPRRSNTTIWVEVNFDNSSAVLMREGQGEKKAEDYVLIVAGVAGTTVVLSAIIIVAICFIFRQDRQYRSKHPQHGTQAGINDDGEFFTNMPGNPGNLCDDEKLRPSLEEEGDDKNNHNHPPGGYNDEDVDDEDDDSGFKKKIAMETFRSSQRKKEVSFAGCVPVAEEGAGDAAGSPIYRNGANYGLAVGTEKVEFVKHPHAFLQRQLEEVGSDTSGDTGTSDSGRGGSEDDVNIDMILHGERQASGGMHAVVPSVQPSLDNERYTRFPPPRAPGKGDPHHPHHHNKPYHVRFDTRTTTPTPSQHGDPHDLYSTRHNPPSRSVTPSYDSSHHYPASQRVVSFSPSTRGSPGPSLFPPRASNRDKSFPSASYRDVSFTPVPQHSPQRTLSTFSSPSSPPPSFTTFQSLRAGSRTGGEGESGDGGASAPTASATSVDDDASTTTSGSYTVNPEELRMEGYIGADVIV
ncbi:protocadherin-7-like [Littorina saxatilis]|uniref:Cadherin domain-containing protein n=1 Tax=Littorina saxatilis TaxID=31220 RepID=A0AAN9G651_9CAEN